MKCITRIVWDIETGAVFERESFEYSGRIEKLCGGPSQQQQQAENSQTSLNNALASQFGTANAITNPYYANLVQNGLPYFNAQSEYSTSDLAKTADQQKAQLNSQLAGEGGGLPSGFAQAADTRFDADTAEAFDQNQMQLLQAQQAAQMAGAQGLNPLGYAGAATSGNSAVMQMPQNSFWQNVIGGTLGAAGNVFKLNYSAKTGGYVPETAPVLLHKGELVLNPGQQKKYLKAKPPLPKLRPRSIPKPPPSRTAALAAKMRF